MVSTGDEWVGEQRSAHLPVPCRRWDRRWSQLVHERELGSQCVALVRLRSGTWLVVLRLQSTLLTTSGKMFWLKRTNRCCSDWLKHNDRHDAVLNCCRVTCHSPSSAAWTRSKWATRWWRLVNTRGAPCKVGLYDVASNTWSFLMMFSHSFSVKIDLCCSWEREPLWLRETARDVGANQHGGPARNDTSPPLRTLPQKQAAGDGIHWQRVHEVRTAET